jgi:hypothetical protein
MAGGLRSVLRIFKNAAWQRWPQASNGSVPPMVWREARCSQRVSCNVPATKMPVVTLPSNRPRSPSAGDSPTLVWMSGRYSLSLSPLFRGLTSRKQFVVTCKGCHRDVPSGLIEFPFQSVAVECPLCHKMSRYRPSEVFMGKPDHLVTHHNRMGAKVILDLDSQVPRINNRMG